MPWSNFIIHKILSNNLIFSLNFVGVDLGKVSMSQLDGNSIRIEGAGTSATFNGNYDLDFKPAG